MRHPQCVVLAFVILIVCMPVCRTRQSYSRVQRECSPESHEPQHANQDDTAKLHMEEEQTKADERLRKHAHYCSEDPSIGQGRKLARQVGQQGIAAAQQNKKKRSASQSDEGTSKRQEVADNMQTVSEVTNGPRCKASKRCRPENQATLDV